MGIERAHSNHDYADCIEADLECFLAVRGIGSPFIGGKGLARQIFHPMEDYQSRNDDGQTGEGIGRLADIAITIQFTRTRALAYLSLASLIKVTFWWRGAAHSIGNTNWFAVGGGFIHFR